MSSIRMINTNGEKKVQVDFDSEELLDFCGTKSFKIYLHLFKHIIRKNIDTGKPFKIYKDYYCKGKLAARMSQKRIADYLGVTEITVQRNIKTLTDKGYLEKVTKRVAEKTFNIYVFGTHENNVEKLFIDDKVYEESLAEELGQFQSELF
jgi:hypothetical protein